MLLGLRDLHRNKLFHGSLQPSNVLVEKSGRAVLSDYTMAKALAPDEKYREANFQWRVLQYQAPESGDHEEMTAAADVYSWAMLSLEIASGCKPKRY